MAAERIFEASCYVPVDVVARDPRTRVLDLNASNLPRAWLEDIDLALFLAFSNISSGRSSRWPPAPKGSGPSCVPIPPEI